MGAKKSTITKDKIASMYMNFRLENIGKLKSVYQFAKTNSFDETIFYSYFANVENLEKEVFKIFLEKTLELIQKDSNYESYDTKSKMLSFYFTFFEILSANRSYVTMSLKEHQNPLKNLTQLSSLKSGFRQYVLEIYSNQELMKNEKIQIFQKKALQETAWIQLLMTLKFWLSDESPAFEKTDIYIEKSVKLSFELMNSAPLDSLIDFGKFIYKEKIQNI
ncbi:TetR family transcriptional regulator C-terminal domain-containing protein [uncultured Flavobacterium sp.]|uniref:TetR family transcriptional regulator C-terminal domain-containing protein n=1 Tax=uncultured Flavobacterium sp. TaxID=165435 RepID=UPI0030CA138A